MKPLTRLVAIAAICLSSIWTACKKDIKNNPDTPGNPPVETPVSHTTVKGIVVNELDQPLANVKIVAGNASSFSDATGTFTLSNVPVSDNRIVVSCSKENFFDATLASIPSGNGVTNFKAVMSARKIISTFTAATGVSATTTDGIAIQIPAGSIMNTNGTTYDGEVKMAARYIDPQSPNFGFLMPGGDFAAVNKNQQNVQLYSYGAMEVELESSAGAPLQIKAGKEATLTFPVSPTQTATAPGTLLLWYFDEAKAKWVEEGSLLKQGNKYVGQVKHFTAWNADEAASRSTLKGKVTKCDGSAASNMVVAVDEQRTVTDENGNYEMFVASGFDLKVSIISIQGTFNTSDTIDVPALAAQSTRSVNLSARCEVYIVGHVQKANGTRAQAFVSLTSKELTKTIQTDDQGNFRIAVPPLLQMTIIASLNTGENSIEKSITTPRQGTLDVGAVVANIAAPNAEEVSFTLNGSGYTNQAVVITAATNPFMASAYYEPEQDITVLQKGTLEYIFLGLFNGKQVGFPDESASITIAIGHTKALEGSLSDENLNFQVTRYGGVGGLIEGKFSGEFDLLDLQTGASLGKVTITNGKFSLLRSKDQ